MERTRENFVNQKLIASELQTIRVVLYDLKWIMTVVNP